MSFTHAAFAIAGLVAAAGPVIIHLLNRRRFRTVEWGAMAFLRKAMHRSRKAVRLRDLLLLALRTIAVLLFGLALARPLLTRSGLSGSTLTLLAIAVLATFAGAIGVAIARTRAKRAGLGLLSLAGIAGLIALLMGPNQSMAAAAASSTASRQPIHAIFVLDNSRSMGVRTLGGTLLDAAKQRAETAIANIPPESRISVLPLCGPEQTYTLDAYRHVDDALEAIERIEMTDRAGSVLRMLSLVAEAAKRVPDLPVKQTLFLSDQQATGWPRGDVAEAIDGLGGPVQFVEIRSASTGSSSAGLPNVWIDNCSVQDGLAESGQPATFLASIRYVGEKELRGVEASLSIDGEVVASQTVDLQPGQSRQVQFSAPMEADAAPGTTELKAATLTVRISDPSANLLERDDARQIAVPVVTAVPVVFVDQFGREESLEAGKIGETYRLRRLLAPRPAEGIYDPLVSVEHVTIEELSVPLLEEARLVVIAGVERPTDEAVRLLRQFIEQGGPVLIAAGANFDPASWNEVGWRDGQGVLPAPLSETPIGVRPSQAVDASQIAPFRLDTATLDHPFFKIEGEPAEALSDLWNQPYFFQAVEAEVSSEVSDAAVASEEQRIVAEREAIEAGRDSEELTPSWLLWKNDARAAYGDNPDANRVGAASASSLARRTAPRVLARFSSNGSNASNVPYVVERQLGYGRVVMLTAGISSDWDTLGQTNAIILLDRITRSLLQETLPDRMYETGETVLIPVERQPGVSYAITPPEGETRSVPIDATESGFAVRLDETSLAGTYTLAARSDSSEVGEPVSQTVVVVNGPAEESDLTTIASVQWGERIGEANARWVGSEEPITFAAGSAYDDRIWKWLAGGMMCCLFGEMLVSGRSRLRNDEVAR